MSTMHSERKGASTDSSAQGIAKTEIDGYLTTYDFVLTIWKVQHDNYFKRVQVLMMAIEAGLFATLLKLWLNRITNIEDLAISATISILGVLVSIVWCKYIRKQGTYLEYCRSLLRNVERRLIELRFPLGYFALESYIFSPKGVFPGKLADTEELEYRRVHFARSNENFPSAADTFIKRGGMIALDRGISIGASVIWFLMLMGLLHQAILKYVVNS